MLPAWSTSVRSLGPPWPDTDNRSIVRPRSIHQLPDQDAPRQTSESVGTIELGKSSSPTRRIGARVYDRHFGFHATLASAGLLQAPPTLEGQAEARGL